MKGYSTKAASLLAALVLVMFMAGIVSAKSAPSVKDERKLNTEIMMLNKDATLPHGDQVVMDNIAKEFNVTGGKLTALRDKNLGYGEIATIYAFADKMSGGINDENVNRVVSMHEQHKGSWLPVAESLNVDLAHVAGKVGAIEDDAHAGIKQALIQYGTAAGGMSSTGERGGGYGTGSGGGGSSDIGGSGGGY